MLNEEPEGGYTVTVPALPGCITYGENLQHAQRMARAAIEGYIVVLKEQGEKVPDESKILEYSLTMFS